MTLRFFADHCVSNLIIHWLERAGHQVLRLKDHLPVESPDTAAIARAQELDAVLLSLNGDFADIVTYPPPAGADLSFQVCGRGLAQTLGAAVLPWRLAARRAEALRQPAGLEARG